MKKRMMCVATIVTLALLVWVLGAGTAFAGGGLMPGKHHIRFAGKGADAIWTTCPSGPVPNEVCTDTYISVAVQMYGEKGARFPSTAMSLSQYSYMVDDEGNWTYISDMYGYGDASLTIDKKLTRASASGEVQVTICTPDGCYEGGPVTVNASWTGVGKLTRSHGNYTYRSTPGSKYTYHWRGTNRSATASGQVNGLDLGASAGASLWDSKSVDIWVEHGSY